MTALLLILVPMALIGLGLPLGWLSRLVQAWLRRLRPPPPLPAVLPIERVATNLRRLDRDLRRYAVEGPLPGKHTRVVAAQQAYEDLLVQACAALDVEQRLREFSGSERSVEVLRVEAALAAAGLPIAA